MKIKLLKTVNLGNWFDNFNTQASSTQSEITKLTNINIKTSNIAEKGIKQKKSWRKRVVSTYNLLLLSKLYITKIDNKATRRVQESKIPLALKEWTRLRVRYDGYVTLTLTLCFTWLPHQNPAPAALSLRCHYDCQRHTPAWSHWLVSAKQRRHCRRYPAPQGSGWTHLPKHHTEYLNQIQMLLIIHYILNFCVRLVVQNL